MRSPLGRGPDIEHRGLTVQKERHAERIVQVTIRTSMSQRTSTTALGAGLLNRDAGSHIVTTDPGELAACLRAGRASWTEFPYYEARYAERGYRFCNSDTAWLVTLCDLEPARALEQVLWLGRVLSSRGMPQYLLECHLRNLHDELMSAQPRRASRYRNLHIASLQLRRRRRSQISLLRFRSIAAEFEAKVEGLPGRVERMGEIVVAAAADEGLGILNAVPSLVDWTCDATRFSADWIEAVQEALAGAERVEG